MTRMEVINEIESSLQERISKVEASLGTTFKICSNEDDYFKPSPENKLLIQENRITALAILRAKINNFPVIVQIFPNLAQLTIFRSDLSIIPPEIVKLSNLQELSLSRNNIRTIPEYICQLRHLTDLDLSKNKIHSIPDSICGLPNLKILRLSDNEITTLPEDIGAIPHLEKLFLARNQITLLPSSFSQCSSLRWFDLSQNPLVSLAGVHPTLLNIVDFEFATAALTFKGCFLAQIRSINISIQMDYDRRHVRHSYFHYNGALADLPAEEIHRFVDVLFEDHIISGYNLDFPCLPDSPRDSGIGGFIPIVVLPEFRAFLLSFLKDISEYNEDSWKDYYARHPIDLARVYVKNPGTQNALSQDERERLIHECNYRLYNYLKDNLPSKDPLLQDLHGKFTIETSKRSLYL
ncbi:MAG: leucine-rich repeat domain-containing protein [Promethearchaeota archaeon]